MLDELGSRRDHTAIDADGEVVWMVCERGGTGGERLVDLLTLHELQDDRRHSFDAPPSVFIGRIIASCTNEATSVPSSPNTLARP